MGVLGDQRRCLSGPLLLMSANSAVTDGSSTWLVRACMALPYFSFCPVPGLHGMRAVPVRNEARAASHTWHQCSVKDGWTYSMVKSCDGALMIPLDHSCPGCPKELPSAFRAVAGEVSCLGKERSLKSIFQSTGVSWRCGACCGSSSVLYMSAARAVHGSELPCPCSICCTQMLHPVTWSTACQLVNEVAVLPATRLCACWA